MKIHSISLSVFELQSNTRPFSLELSGLPPRERWAVKRGSKPDRPLHVLHVQTDEGVEGVCTVGDARYTTMTREDLDELRLLAIGENALAREHLYRKLQHATRYVYSTQGWFGTFDNCLWDIAGKAAGLPVADLIGRARQSIPCYYNFAGERPEQMLEDAKKAVSLGFVALKDHFHGGLEQNIRTAKMLRESLPAGTILMHDAANEDYSFEEAIKMGRALDALGYHWFEEPLADRSFGRLKSLCAILDIPVLACETMMNDVQLCAEWVTEGATDKLRANGRLGVTPLLKLAALAELRGTTIEFNGPGGLFGLVNAHLACAVPATTFYEVFPDGSRDRMGKEIGLTNPPLAQNGVIAPPSGPGWGAQWDWDYFRKKRVTVL